METFVLRGTHRYPFGKRRKVNTAWSFFQPPRREIVHPKNCVYFLSLKYYRARQMINLLLPSNFSNIQRCHDKKKRTRTNYLRRTVTRCGPRTGLNIDDICLSFSFDDVVERGIEDKGKATSLPPPIGDRQIESGKGRLESKPEGTFAESSASASSPPPHPRPSVLLLIYEN